MRGIPAAWVEGRRVEGKQQSDSPVRERRCILAACCFAELAALVVPTMFADCLPTGLGADEEDMDSSSTWAQ
jgi:hypothetical protein